VSYEVLARKWRPQTFDEVVGQEHITRTLKKAVELRRLSHAYLFSGPRGCGKTSTARILAKVINCLSLQGGNPCNECESCLGVTQGRNLDVMEIDGASHTGVNEVRDLQESIGYVPSQFQNKIYIIDEVHMLSTHAFNALLKTLEEPPAHVYFIFATTAPQKIPDTIKSRCQRHQFKRLEVRDITEHLEKICHEEKVKFEKDALRLLARKAEGSMRDAQSLLDQCITAASGDVKTDAVRDILGLLDEEMILRFLATVARGDPGAVLKELDNAVHDGVDLEELLNALIEGFRDMMLLSVSDDLAELVYRSAEDTASMRELLAGLEVGDLVTIVERLCTLSPRLKLASDPRVLLESVLVDLALLDRQVAIRELIGRLEGSGSGPGGGSARPPAEGAVGRPAAPRAGTGDKAQPPKISAAVPERDRGGPSPAAAMGERGAEGRARGQRPAEVGEPQGVTEPLVPPKDTEFASLDYASQRRLWESFVTQVRQKKVTLGVCLISGTLASIEEGVVTLRFAKGCAFQREQVEEAANQKFLESATKKYFGKELRISCAGVDDGKETRRRPKEKTAPAGQASADGGGIEANPLVQKIIDDFDGEIIRHHPQ
jgi:DNA polymerase-3 subunit gamma/tau